MSAQEIITFIGNTEKKTNVVTFEGVATAVPASVTKLGNVLFGDWKDIRPSCQRQRAKLCGRTRWP